MTEPYYADDTVTLYQGDCREIAEWLSADVLVTDPPYGIRYRRGKWAGERGHGGHEGIAGDVDTSTRDQALALWGALRPGLVFGSLRAPFPHGWRKALVFGKPTAGCGLFGQRDPWLSNWEPIFVIGRWPDQTPTRSAIVATRAKSASGYSGYATRAGHAHAKPVDVMEQLIAACPSGVIADPFAGSGSTLIGARNLGRRAIGIELDERCCERIAARLAADVLPLGAS
jgi:DNA modification methylase